MSNFRSEVLIIGAGISGLLAAQTLQQTGRSAIVLEKESLVGGRMMTETMGSGRADTGAQYLVARQPAFQAMLTEWEEAERLSLWAVGWGGGSLQQNLMNAHPHYVVNSGMNALPRYLADELDVRTGSGATSIGLDGARWVVQTENGDEYVADALILTPPPPVTLALIEDGQIAIDDEVYDALAQIEYAPALVALFHVEGELHLPPGGAVQHPAHSIPWVIDNQRKGISSEATIVTLQAGHAFSRRMWDASEYELVDLFRAALNRYVTPTTEITKHRLVRWRYAMPTSHISEQYWMVVNEPPLLFAGDAFGSGGVEGAALSGRAVAEDLALMLAHRKQPAIQPNHLS